MQIIEKMADGPFEVVCDAGHELVKELLKVLSKHNLPIEQATNIMAVAAAGVAVASSLSTADFAVAIDLSRQMWVVENRDGHDGIRFDPPHRREGFVPAGRNPASEN